jgi:hypothetical protein
MRLKTWSSQPYVPLSMLALPECQAHGTSESTNMRGAHTMRLKTWSSQPYAPLSMLALPECQAHGTSESKSCTYLRQGHETEDMEFRNILVNCEIPSESSELNTTWS